LTARFNNEFVPPHSGGMEVNMENLKRELRERYISTYNECKKFKYFPRAFLDMVVSSEDIVDVTRKLVHKEGGTSGFTTLFENKRMDLSVERIILEPRYRELFTTEDLQAAYDRLKAYEYDELNEIKLP
jgi:hypothetical protein